jgi:hypothetical protein
MANAIKNPIVPITLNFIWENPDEIKKCCQCHKPIEGKGVYITLANVILSVICYDCSDSIIKKVRQGKDFPEMT